MVVVACELQADPLSRFRNGGAWELQLYPAVVVVVVTVAIVPVVTWVSAYGWQSVWIP